MYTVSRVGEFNGDTILFRLSNNDIVEKLLKRIGELQQSFAYREQIFKMMQSYTYFCTKKIKRDETKEEDDETKEEDDETKEEEETKEEDE